MCGIVGYIGSKDCVNILVEGLSRLEYRGYDSSGIAVIDSEGKLNVCKKQGKLRQMQNALPSTLSGGPGIGHTRWATHGEPNDANAHPHVDSTRNIAVVHNGIIENAAELRAGLERTGVVFASDTDSECLAHLISAYRTEGLTLEEAVGAALRRVEGTYGLVVLDARESDKIVVARNGSPVILGIGENEMLVASDVSALVRHTSRVIHLDDREMAVLRHDSYRSFALGGTETTKQVLDVDWSVDQLEKGDHEHYMRKEILEQPEAVHRALRGRLVDEFSTVKLGGVNMTAREALAIRRIKIVGCGTAYYAGLAGAQLLEALTRIPADAEPASEFRYRNPVIERDVLYIAVSQSGETADTLAALQEIKRKGGQVLAVVNAVGSTIAREADGIYLHAGPEVSVASTKVFSSMIVAFALLAVHLGRIRDLSPTEGQRIIDGLRALPGHIQTILDQEDHIAALAEKYAKYPSMFFIGRNTGYPIALEGAQKLKEVSYNHAEAYPASELKHGPLALVSADFPVVAIIPNDALVEKNLSSVQQVRARKGPVLGVVQNAASGVSNLAYLELFDDVIYVPPSEPELSPILCGIPLQLFAYHAAKSLRRDVDQPRNLAKSVTVE